MDCEYPHQSFFEFPRPSQSLCNDRCQNILYKAVFEHFVAIKTIAALLLVSKSFQNSSFGANFLVNYIVNHDSIPLIESVLSPSSCFSLQFTPSLYIRQHTFHSEKSNRGISNFVGELVKTKYLRLSLRTLILDEVDNDVIAPFFRSFSNSWPQLKTLSLVNCSAWSYVRDLTLDTNFSDIVDSGLERVSQFSNITSLNIFNCAITDVGLEHISKLSFITSLNLYSCRDITDGGLESISKLSGITSLDLSYCRKITDAGLEHISKLSGITSLNLGWCYKISDVGLEHLVKLSAITSLDLSWCDKISDAGLKHLSKLANFTSLNLTVCQEITDVGLEHISKLSGLTILNLSKCLEITDFGLEKISKLSRITSLNLACCDKITNVALQHISALSNVTSLNLSECCEITREAMTKLNIALPNCNVLRDESSSDDADSSIGERLPQRRSRSAQTE